MQHDYEAIVEIIRNEKPAELEIFTYWFRNVFHDRPELVEKITDIQEVRTMLRTSVEKYGKKMIKEGMEKSKLDTAGKLLKKKMPVKEIAEVTGLPVDRIEKLIDK